MSFTHCFDVFDEINSSTSTGFSFKQSPSVTIDVRSVDLNI